MKKLLMISMLSVFGLSYGAAGGGASASDMFSERNQQIYMDLAASVGAVISECKETLPYTDEELGSKLKKCFKALDSKFPGIAVKVRDSYVGQISKALDEVDSTDEDIRACGRAIMLLEKGYKDSLKP